MFEIWFPIAYQYGLTQEEFWDTNPRILKVYEKGYRNVQNRQNDLMYAWWGNYGLSALFTAIDGCLNGRKAKSKYLEEPIRIFPMTEEEKVEKERQETERFIAWANAIKADFDSKKRES